MGTKKIKCLYRCKMCGNSFLVTHEVEKDYTFLFDDFFIEFGIEPHNPCITQESLGFKIGVGELVSTENAF